MPEPRRAPRPVVKQSPAFATCRHPSAEGALVGPLVAPRAHEAMEAALARACADGGEVLVGGERVLVDEAPAARYVRPAVVRMPAQTDVVHTETFAPVLYVMTYDDLDEAIAFLEGSLPGLVSTLHLLGPPWIELDLAAGIAEVETPSVNSATYEPGEDGDSMQNVSGGRYRDRFARREGGWAILERRNRRVWAHNLPETGEPPVPRVAADPEPS